MLAISPTFSADGHNLHYMLAGQAAQQPSDGKTMRMADADSRAFNCHIPYLQNRSRDAEPPRQGFKVCDRHSAAGGAA